MAKITSRVSTNNSPLEDQPATEQTLQDVVNATNALAMEVIDAISSTAYDVEAAPYSETTNITTDYIFDSLTLNFSTDEAKTITVTSSDGTILLGGNLDTSSDNKLYNTTAQSFNLIFKQAFNANDNITVAVTQTTGACLMDCILKIRKGTSTLIGNPVLDQASKVQLVDSNGVAVTESYFSTVKTIDIVHNQTHRGRLYSGGHYFGTVANNGSADLLIQVGANPIHFTAHTDVIGDALAYVYEGTTVSDAGTACTVSNHNRSSANTTTITLTHTPSIDVIGSQLNSTFYIPGGAGGKAVGAATEGFEGELILAANTNYLVRVRNISGQAQHMACHITFYEQY